MVSTSLHIPECTDLKRLTVQLKTPAGLNFLKLASSHLTYLEELILKGLISREKKLEIESDFLKCIDLRDMKQLAFIKLQGKAKPVQVGL